MPKQEVRADLLLGRDTLSPGLIKAGRAAADAGGNVKDLSDKLRNLSDRTYDARLGLKGDKETGQTLDKLTAQLIRLSQRKVDPEVDLEGYLRTRAQITGIELALDRLNAKRTRLHIAIDKAAGLGFLQPGVLGAGLALLPTLIPLTAGVAAGATAVGVSFGAAAAGVAGFGLMASTVLQGTTEDLKKLQTLQMALNKATTAAQKKAVEQQIKDLKAGWSKGYLDLIDNYQKFQQKWKSVSQAITVPTLNVWLPVLTRGLQFLKPLIKPVADAFTLWGITLNTYFKDPAAARHIKDMAAAFGNFAAQQLFRIGQFIKDIGLGVLNLGRDFAASGANFSGFGVWLSGIGDAFLRWSRSKKARDDVQGFMRFLHDEGPVVKGILSDLADILPGIFAGATTVGTLELQALGNFLNLVASLPPGWQKPLTEFAGAMLLLSKIGVVKVGLKLTGLGAGALAAAGGSTPLAAGGAAIAAGLVLRIREDLHKGIKGILDDLPIWLSGVGGVLQLSAQGWADAIVNRFQKPVLAAEKAFGRAFVASAKADWDAVTASMRAFAGIMVASMKAFGGALLASARASWNAVTASFRAFTGAFAASFRAFRSSVASIWDTIWRNTVTRARNGISDVVGWFRTLPGRAIGALTGLGSRLYAFAHQALVKFGNGAKAVWSSIVHWFSGLPKTILHALGIKSPPDWAISAGRHVMQGILNGLHLGSGGISGFIRGLPGKIGALLGGGSSGATGGDALANQNLARRIFPWGAAQWPSFVNLVMAESGFNRFARNPSSGAYGIPQALPPSKLPFAGQAAGGSHAGPQLSWMFNYIRGRYGTPANAWGHEVAYRWYDQGGILPPGLTLALNTTGHPEQVISGRSGPAPAAVVLEIRSSGRRADDLLVELIRDAVRVRGGGNVQVALGKRN